MAIAAGAGHDLALLSNGTVICWGLTNLYPTSTNALVFETNLTGVKAISLGFHHNLAIASDGLPPLLTEPPAGFAPAGGSMTLSVNGVRLANVQYQWQFVTNYMSGTNIVLVTNNITGATNSSLTLNSVNSADIGSYQVVVSSGSASATSLPGTFGLAYPPQILYTAPSAGVTWVTTNTTLSIAMSTIGISSYPLRYQWQFNGTNIAAATNSSYTIFNPVATNEANYTVAVTNSLGGTNATWTVRMAFPGMVEAWGSDGSGESDRPVGMTNVAGIAAGEYQSVVVTDSGTVVQWGKYSDGTNFYSVANTNVASLPPTSNVIAVVAGLGQALALKSDGTVTNWGLNGAFGNSIPTNLTNVTAIACGWQFDVALLNNGTVRAWSLNNPAMTNIITNVPAGLSNVTAIAAGHTHTLALSNGTVVAWGYATNGQTSVPTTLTNVVAIAAGAYHSLALQSNGLVMAWGAGTNSNPSDGVDYGQSMVPHGLSNVLAIAAGDFHSVALQNDGTLVEWGDNTNGQATVPSYPPSTFLLPPPVTNIANQPPILVKKVAAGGDHTMAAIFSPLIQYPVDVSKDLLLIYNTNSLDSSNVCQYYLTHRPMVSNAIVLGIGCTTNDPIWPPDFTNVFQAQVQA